MPTGNKKRGFAAMAPEKLREIASHGGIARKRAFDLSKTKRSQAASLRAYNPDQAQDAAAVLRG